MLAPPVDPERDATAVETVYGIIKRDILTGRRAPGERLLI
jgi:DNA-binding GntR family transcriptional regulator